MIRIRPMCPGDLGFADELRDRAGWNQTLTDWRRFLELAPCGCFVAEWDGVPAGTAVALEHGPGLAWIGMVLVHPAYRRRGVGRALLLHGLEALDRRGVRCVGLDATPMGRPVYAALGFGEDFTITRWEHPGWVVDEPTSPDPRLARWTDDALPEVLSMDAQAFGLGRVSLLPALARESRMALVARRASGEFTGFGMIREGARAWYLGPVVASDPETGLALAESLLAIVGGGRVFWDVPDAHGAAVEWARGRGFEPQRSLIRMFRGDRAALHPEPRWQCGLSGPETG